MISPGFGTYGANGSTMGSVGICPGGRGAIFLVLIGILLVFIGVIVVVLSGFLPAVFICATVATEDQLELIGELLKL